MNRWVRLGAVVLVVLGVDVARTCRRSASGRNLRRAAVVHAQQLPTELPATKFSSGQDVVPYFEGWIRNPDGTFDLVFGYFNRNWKEELAIPAGPDNIVEPGGPDRGQPTYFLPRRQGWIFRVRVPKDFGKQVADLDDQSQRQDREGLRRAAAGRGNHRTHRHDPRQPEPRRQRSEQGAGDRDCARVLGEHRRACDAHRAW